MRPRSPRSKSPASAPTSEGQVAMGTEEPHQGLTATAFEARVLGFLALGIAGLGSIFCLPPIPQAMSYHAFADDRTLLGVPNFWNVVSNLPFLIVGFLGLGWLVRHDVV